jgi:hypothetical protein
MSPTKDANLIVRAASDGDLTATEGCGGFDVSKTPIEGMSLWVMVPDVDDTADVLDIKIFESSASTAADTTDLIASHPQLDGDTVVGEWVIPFVTDKRFVYVEFVVGVGGGTPNFGAVEAALVLNVGYEWSREVSFR